MIRIGVKSLVLGLVTAGLIAFAGWQQLFDIRRILSLQSEVLWLIGCLASGASLGLSFFLRSRRESPYHLAIGHENHRRPGSLPLLSVKRRGFWIGPRDHEPAAEFGRFGFPLIAGLGLLVFGLIILENRSLVLLKHFYHNLTRDYAHVCPKEGEEALVVKPPKMGCDLVKKAFALGYSKDLGDCADEEEDKEEQICTHRQWDEPAMHYSFRLVQRFFQGLLTSKEGKESLAQEFEKLPVLVKTHSEGFLGVPRAAVHIFTDLPEPGGLLAKARRRLHPNHCQDELRELRFRMAERGEEPGAQLEDTLSHLLFSPAVGRDAAYCRPFTIHWGTSLNTCRDLVSKGEAMLDQLDLRASVTEVMKRSEHAKISFHCLMSEGSSQTHGTLNLGGRYLTIEGVVLPKVRDDGRFLTHALFEAVAQVFVPWFHYTNLDRKVPLMLNEERFKLEIARHGESMKLAKYELLRSSDILAGDQWVYHYPEYLDVYPWQPHMANFVSRFRKAYQQNEAKP